MPPEVPRFLPPSQAERAHTIARQMTPRSTLGATRDAQPVTGREVSRAGARSIASGGQAASNVQTWEDLFTLAAAGAQSVTLTYLPTNDRSEDVKLNGIGQTRGADWTRTGSTLSILAVMDARANDQVKCQYTYLVGLSGTPFDTSPLSLMGGGTGGIYSSQDGITWIAQSSPTSNTLYGAVWSGSKYVYAGGNGTILTSPDGVTWTVQNGGTTSSLYKVTWSVSLSTFVMVGLSGTILTSPDGITWTARTLPVPDDLNSVTG